MSELQTVLMQARRLSPTEQLQLIISLAEHLARLPRQPGFANDRLHRSIAEYAADVAGSEFDFDDELEAAAVEHLMNDEAEQTAYHSCKRDACAPCSPCQRSLRC